MADNRAARSSALSWPVGAVAELLGGSISFECSLGTSLS